MRKIAIAATCLLTAVLVAGVVSAQSVGIGIKKTAPLSGTGSSGSPLKLDVCLAGSAYVSNGTSWACAAGASGDIEGVTAGNGLTGGGTTGTVTLDVAVGAGLTAAVDAINLNLTGASCSVGSYMSALGSTGTGTCTAEVGDISSVVAGTGLVTGGTSGAVTVDAACGSGLTCNADNIVLNMTAQSCSAGQHISAATATGVFTCSASGGAGDIEGVTAGAMLTGGGTTGTVTLDLAISSDFQNTGDALDLSTAVTAPGSLAVATTLDVTGMTSLQGVTNLLSNNGYFYVKYDEINAHYNTNAEATLYFNTNGYLDGPTQFRNMVIRDGKTATVATFTGSTKAFNNVGAVDFDSTLNVDGATTVHDFRGTAISPAQLVAATNDWAPTGHATATIINVNTTAGVSITGLSGGADGRRVTIRNTGADYFTLAHQSASSTAANRFKNGSSNTVYVDAGGSIELTYDGTASRWMTGASGRFIDVLYAVSGFTSAGHAYLASTVAVDGNTTLGNADSDTVDSRATFGVSGTDVTINACGTSPTVSGEAQSFQLTPGTATTTCVVNFNRTFTNAPYCIFSAANARAALQIASGAANAGDEPYVTATTTTMTMTFVANTESTPTFNVWCPGRY